MGPLVAALATLAALNSSWRLPAEGTPRRAQDDVSPVTIAWDSWEPGAVGAWAPFIVVVENAGAVRFGGKLVLRPYDASRSTPGRAGGPGTVMSQQLPSYTSDLDVGARARLRVVTFLPSLEVPFVAEIRDRSNRLLASGQPKVPAGADAPQVGLLTDDPSLVGLGQVRLSQRFRSIAEFPTSAERLVGLNILVLTRVDSERLSSGARSALSRYVALGGSVVLTGGTGGFAVVKGLPASLVPMRPTGTARTTLTSLEGLLGIPVPVETEALVGEVAKGRVVERDPQGLPLIVEASYGAGRIVQLSFDPLAEPGAVPVRPGSVTSAIWSSVVLRAVVHGSAAGSLIAPTRPAPGGVPFPTLWALLDELSPGRPPVFAGVALIVYGLAAGLVLFLVVGGRAWGRHHWLLVAMVVIFLPAFGYVLGHSSLLRQRPTLGLQVTVRDSDGTGWTDRYEVLPAAAAGRTASDPRRNTLVAMVSAPAVAPDGLLRRLLPLPADSPGPLVEGGDVVAGSTGTVVHPPPTPAWSRYRVRSSGPADSGPGPAATLRLVGNRLQGKVTNPSGVAMHDVRIFSPAGSSVGLARELRPGASVAVDTVVADAPLAAAPPVRGRVSDVLVQEVGASTPLSPGQVGVAARMATRPGWLTVGITRVGVSPTAGVGLGLGDARLVCVFGTRTKINVYEMQVPEGVTAPLRLSDRVVGGEIFNWPTRTWRQLPTSNPKELADGDIQAGIVRVRVPQEGDPGGLRLAYVS